MPCQPYCRSISRLDGLCSSGNCQHFSRNLHPMKLPFRTPLGFLIAAVLLASVASALADSNQPSDHDLARKALLEGRIRPLTEITEMVKSKIPGVIVSVQIEVDDHHRFVYEFDIITKEGKLKEVDVDAATAAVLKIEGDE